MGSSPVTRHSSPKIGLLGGSFNPAHEGHLHISREALRLLQLDEVWWLVSPQNPLKGEEGMAGFSERIASAETVAAAEPRIRVSDIEARLGTRYTADTLQAMLSGAAEGLFPSPLGGEGQGEGSGHFPISSQYRKANLHHANSLRRAMTDAERKLWFHLRNRQLSGAKFRRQQPVGPYIVDFVCMEHSLIVEVDGGQHAGSANDRQRDAALTEEGFTVLRFWNHEVLGNIDGVLQQLQQVLATTPHPQGEREHRFIWLMGADNLAQFGRWKDWEWIAGHVPIAVFARGQEAAPDSVLARSFAHARLPAADAASLADAPPPAWCYLPTSLHPASSTAIRAGGKPLARRRGVPFQNPVGALISFMA